MTALPSTRQARVGRIVHGTRPVRGFVVHDAEAENLDGVRNYFATSSPDAVGAHLGISVDGKRAEQWADLEALVYHCRGANGFTVGCELMGYASTANWRWVRRVRQRAKLANRIGWVCWHYGLGVPRRGKNVWGHVDFPEGGHHDPGVNFPWGRTMKRARRAYRNLVRSNGGRW